MISIVIINYNVKKHLEESLDTLYQYHNISSFEVIVIDNNSNEKIDNIKEGRTNLHLYYLDSNKGYSTAVNFGIKKSNGSKILLLNPDTYFKNNVIEKMSDYLDGNNDVGIVGGKVVYPNGDYQLSSKRRFPDIYLGLIRFIQLHKFASYISYFGRYNYLSEDCSKLLEVDAVSGACMMFKKEIIDKVGYFDENYFLYFEDTDFCYVVKNNNYKVIYNPEIEIVHYNRQSFNHSNYSVNYEFYKSLYLFYIKYYDDYNNFFIIKILVKYFLKILISILSVFNKKSKVQI